ncbi:hypothetical protein [Vibrio mediterranei]|uniref:hypothetical protein n=1 Tax=Vibrio mediterranei TaxID=689 RepID=UPI00148DD4B7|nr:hypothetical protein [Vibrio mediterranei]NOI26654.1 hypothetical protein [Vibrio mediterranei]
MRKQANTQNIDAYLRRYVGRLTGVQMAKHLDCSTATVYSRAKKLGLKLRLHGEAHPNAKATNQEVELIRQLYEEGLPVSDIVQKMGLSQSFIYAVISHARRAYD